QGSQVALAVDDSELGRARSEQARAALRAAGFRVSPPITVPAPPAPLPDLAPVAGTLATGSPAVVLLLTSPAATGGLSQQLTQLHARRAGHGGRGALATDALAGSAVRCAGAERRVGVPRGRAVRVREADRGEDPEALDDHDEGLAGSGGSGLRPSRRPGRRKV